MNSVTNATRFRLTRAFCGRRGLFAPVAAVAGWFAVLPANREPILVYHRQLGVAVGVVGAALAVWAWKSVGRPAGPE